MSAPAASWPSCSALELIFAGGLHGNNKSLEELTYALTAGVGRIISIPSMRLTDSAPC
jgi:hypothetical protein